ncbi:Superfamily I DNA and/or RNA helicase [Mesobacillus persicus]|uniref:Superfamily I DNA and/or RNA helicase n=1 Tax=Mesobacillus persicus TaxID=930146 RepID=A0A1H7YZW7_9BACI|nr:AAA domain-containing protein [Mesobacillus persicus]SEM51553.1 Superfamily I DNA and/or RNA helicase [Mesobacillus persicus]
MIKTQKTAYRCPMTLTNKAKDKMRELGLDERSFFLLEQSFHIYIEKYPQSGDGLVSAALFLDLERNEKLAAKFNMFVIVLHCLVKPDRLVVTNVTTRPAHIPAASNWRVPASFRFDLNSQSSGPLPYELLNLIHNMPVAQESSMYVKKRIASWEGYLKIQEQTADIPDITTRYSGLIFNDDFSRVKITGCRLNEKEWKSLKDMSVKLKGVDKDIGKVLKANRSASTVEVELPAYMEDQARRGQLDAQPREVVFSNFATLSQVKRLRQGFKQLENGLAANPELERLLFENKPPVKEIKKQARLQFHNQLNEFQKAAVTGAMSAEDLYVIQGPPGTGKTTVISEICLQNARAGLWTLVASQSNLAVDNALGRLLANKDIRILRVGRTESIEEEGKKFIEENVGQYWKDHTLKEVSSQFETRKQRETEIETEWSDNEREHDRLQQELVRVEAKLEAKKKAQEQSSEIQSIINKLEKDIHDAQQERDTAQQLLQKYAQSLRLLSDTIEKDESFLAEAADDKTIQNEWEANQQEIERLKASAVIQELEDEILELKQRIEQTSSAELEKWKEAVTQQEALIERTTAAKKLDSLKWLILEQNLTRTLQVQSQIEKLNHLRERSSQLEKLKTYNEKLNPAISYLEQLLADQYEQLREQLKTTPPVSTTAVEIDQILDKLRSELKAKSKIQPERLVAFLKGLYGRRNYIWRKAEQLKLNDTEKKMAQDALQHLKKELIVQLNPVLEDRKLMFQKYQKEVAEHGSRLSFLQSKQKQLMESADLIPNAIELLHEKETKGLELQKMKEQLEEAQMRVERNRQKQDQEAQQLEEAEQKEGQIEDRLLELSKMLREKQAELVPLNEIIATEPEQEHEEVLKKLASVSFTRESLKQEKEKLPLFQSVQGMWQSMLAEANDHDLNEIRKLYVKHANVIGTTCVASARKDFMDSYPVFDVVIIDEVSKATPPELLLPMLKGKKVILVGDHHQLPPLLGDDTLEETLQAMAEESEDFEGKAELKKLLNESLFERLFKNLPQTNKMMLAIQYRMHENIMETIAPFYRQENEQLQCGLTDSDRDRDHKLSSPHIKRNHHLLWMDMPNEPGFFEERMKGGKSLYNPAELKTMAELLKELDEATAEAKQAGRMEADEKKSIGVISFYGEQVKRIDRMLQQELRLPNLTIRTGTVDRFQGMEMDVILLSMVRNHDNKQDDIGFAKDYRRLNVALSRARELLVMVGSTKMFTERSKNRGAREMYTHVLESAKKQDGLRPLEEVPVHG